MRLWHYKLIPYLPKSQLLAQWRELNSIFKKQNEHILINYVYNYEKIYLWNYTMAVLEEMTNRKYKLTEKSKDNLKNYFEDMGSIYLENLDKMFHEHNDEYLTICYWNLREKYLRGQKDFTKEIWDNLEKFYTGEMEK